MKDGSSTFMCLCSCVPHGQAKCIPKQDEKKHEGQPFPKYATRNGSKEPRYRKHKQHQRALAQIRKRHQCHCIIVSIVAPEKVEGPVRRAVGHKRVCYGNDIVFVRYHLIRHSGLIHT